MIAAPIYQLTKKTTKFEWTQDCQQAFEKIKEAITDTNNLAPYDPRLQTKVTVDAAKGCGTSVTLWQKQKDQTWRAVTHHSRTFSKPEKNYSQIEAESLGVLFGITRNRLYLYGLPHFEVETDHKPLVTLYSETRKNCPPRIERHKLNLQGYNFKLTWRPGT